MSARNWAAAAAVLAIALGGCSNPNPQPPGLTPIPSLAPGQTVTLVPALQTAPAAAVTSAPGVVSQADAALGAPIYLEHCSPCHGIQGEGVIGPALRDNNVIQTAGDQNIFTIVANGVPGSQMPAWLQTNGGPLTTGEINSVIAYLHKLQGVPPLPTATPVPPEPTETPLPPGAPTEEPARPSGGGSPGPAASLTGDPSRGKPLFGTYCAVCHGPEGVAGIPNPDSDDGVVPTLNPIDPTIANPDPKVFAANVDVFIQHGSIPSGPSPLIAMPSFGDSKMLTEQQIADIIAYVLSLNGVK